MTELHDGIHEPYDDRRGMPQGETREPDLSSMVADAANASLEPGRLYSPDEVVEIARAAGLTAASQLLNTSSVASSRGRTVKVRPNPPMLPPSKGPARQ